MTNQIKKSILITNMDENSRAIVYENVYTLPQGNGIDPLLSTIPTAQYTPVKGDRLWFYPGCNIPRFKVKQFCQNNDVAVVKYKDKSSVRFIGPDVIKDLIINSRWYCISKEVFITWLDSVMCNAYTQIRSDIMTSSENTIYMLYPARNKFTDNKYFGKLVLDEKLLEYEHFTHVKNDASYVILTEMLSDSNLKSQDDLLALLNTGTILDEEMYNQIHRLFESSDKENTKVAMEAMSNCDFQKSAVYLLLLVKEYGTKMYNSGNRHHVNFKSLLKYFQLTNITNIDIDDIIDALRHQKLLNVTNLNMLMPLAMKSLKENGDMKNIKIKDLELSPEAEQAIAENILDEDDQPISTEESTEELMIAPTLDTVPGAFK